jgi:hypothetical protein
MDVITSDSYFSGGAFFHSQDENALILGGGVVGIGFS